MNQQLAIGPISMRSRYLDKGPLTASVINLFVLGGAVLWLAGLLFFVVDNLI